MYKSQTSISRTTLLLLAALAAAPLAGCSASDLEADDSMSAFRVADRYPIQVSRGPVVLEVSSRHGSLQPNQMNAVASFARQAMSGGATPVTISRPSGGGASGQVARDIASLFAAQGVPGNMVRTATYPGPASAPVRLTVIKTMAVTRPCGTWDTNLADSADNAPNSNHGCAIQANIAAMVVNPNDFEAPKTMSPSPAASRAQAVSKINNGQSTNTATRSIFSLF